MVSVRPEVYINMPTQRTRRSWEMYRIASRNHSLLPRHPSEALPSSLFTQTSSFQPNGIQHQKGKKRWERFAKYAPPVSKLTARFQEVLKEENRIRSKSDGIVKTERTEKERARIKSVLFLSPLFSAVAELFIPGKPLAFSRWSISLWDDFFHWVPVYGSQGRGKNTKS